MKRFCLFSFVKQISLAVALTLLLVMGCNVKRNVRVAVPPKILEAKTSTLDQLLATLTGYHERVQSLSCAGLKFSYTSGRVESGRLLEYRSAPGYILLERPDSLHLTIQAPVTKTTIAELCSTGDDFSLWVTRENKFYVGHNSTREFDLEDSPGSPAFNARPKHMYEAIMPQGISKDDNSIAISFEEDLDAEARYYVVSVYERGTPGRLRTIRKLWFERSILAVVRQETFEPNGSIASIINYSDLRMSAEMLLPHQIKIDRPADGYSLTLVFNSWRVNQVPAGAFLLRPPPTSKLIELKEKRK